MGHRLPHPLGGMVYPGESFDPETTMAADRFRECGRAVRRDDDVHREPIIAAFERYDVSSCARRGYGRSAVPVEVMKR